jgi:hypothetical protein
LCFNSIGYEKDPIFVYPNIKREEIVKVRRKRRKTGGEREREERERPC